VLQGGTQHNLAAVKAEVDFIRQNFRGAGSEPEIIVHEHCGESARSGRRSRRSGSTRTAHDDVHRPRRRASASPIGRQERADALQLLQEQLPATFIDVKMPSSAALESAAATVGSLCAMTFVSKVPKAADEQRVIIATCEKGSVEDVESMRGIKAGLDAAKKANPNFVEICVARGVARAQPGAWPIRCRTRTGRGGRVPRPSDEARPDAADRHAARAEHVLPTRRSSAATSNASASRRNLVYSDLHERRDVPRRRDARRDRSLLPAKIGIAHVHNLIYPQARARRSSIFIFFPMVDTLHTSLTNLQGSYACPTVTVTPDTGQGGLHEGRRRLQAAGIVYLNPMLNFTEPRGSRTDASTPGASGSASRRRRTSVADHVGYRELDAFERDIHRRAREVIDQLERDDRVGIVMLGRPYHHDPGLNHEILDEFQKLAIRCSRSTRCPSTRTCSSGCLATRCAPG
jgi:hypothetical protein